MAFIYDLTDTWNAGGTTFNAIKMNVTDSASAAASKLVTLQVGGAERFGVRKDGQGYFAGNVGIGTSSPTTSQLHVYTNTDNAYAARFDQDHPTGWGVLIDTDATVNTDPALWVKNATDTIMWAGSGGNVGIGTTSPGRQLDVAGFARFNSSGNYMEFGINELTSEDAGGAHIRAAVTSAANPTYSLSGDKDTGLFFPAANTLAITTGATERMRITSAGLVGIGTTSPANQLDVVGTAPVAAVRSTGGSAGIDTRFIIANSGNGSPGRGVAMSFQPSGSANSVEAVRLVGLQELQSTTANAAAFAVQVANTSGTLSERMRIDSSGNVGIGTSSPDAVKLHVVQGTKAGLAVVPGEVARFESTTSNRALVPIIGRALGQSELWFGDENLISVGRIRYDHTVDAMAFWVNNNERMRIDSSGNVGVGTTSITNSAGFKRLAINDTSGGILEQQVGGVATGRIITSAASVSLDAITSIPLTFKTASTERMRIDSSGNLLVGTTDTTPAGSNVIGAALLTFGGANLSRLNSITLDTNRDGTDGTIINLRKSGTTVGSISVTTTATTYNTSSDARLKENIAAADDAAALIDAIQVRKFDWKIDGSHQRYGMVAQELLEVAPEAVSGEPEGEEMMGVDYSKLVPMLIKEVQSLRARVAQLEGN